MKETFLVDRDGIAFGNAEMIREGLYYRIRVRCPKPVRVQLCGEKGVQDLGICVPSGSGFAIETRVPVKRIGEGAVSFQVAPEFGPFYAASPDKPFSHLGDLRNCVFRFQNGQAGVQIVISNPTGQWSEPKISE